MADESKNGVRTWQRPGHKRWTDADGTAMLAAHAASGLSAAAFAREHQIGAHRIKYWRERLKTTKRGKHAVNRVDSKRFLPVRMVTEPRAERAIAATHSEQETTRHVALELRSGARLKFVGAWDARSIAPWLQAVEVLS